MSGFFSGERTLPARAGVVGRLAPSPTGHMHLGNAWAFLLAWWAARKAGGRVILRMEDIDPDRARAAWATDLIEDMRWLGLDWDAGPGSDPGTDPGAGLAGRGPFIQSARGAVYAQALEHLAAGGHTYPCFCTRRELRALAGAPHVDDIGAPYPGTCRDLSAEQQAVRRAELAAVGRKPCVRLRCPGGRPWRFADALQGPQSHTLEACGGDFALCRSDGVVAYQLAVVVDDALMGVNQVVRGRDILPSTPRQLYVQELLGAPALAYAHVPLLCDAAGERLAKRHASLSLRALRACGVAAAQVVGFLAHRAGLREAPAPCLPQEVLPGFAWERLPRADVCLPGDVAAALKAV